MRVLISADMEGVTGVTNPRDCEPGHPRWEYHRRFLTGDVNAAVAGFAAAGATEILVNEAHADQRNLLLDLLDERATLLIGNHKPLGMMEGIDREPDAVAFIGYHTGAGEAGVLAHTYLPNTITSVLIDDLPASEGRMNALLAAEYAVPVVLVTGDDLTCVDARRYAPDAVGVAVKTCIDRYAAICLPPAVSAAAITEGASLALQTVSSARALRSVPGAARPDVGHSWQIGFDAAHLAPWATFIPGVEQLDERTVRYTLATMYQGIRCFRALTRLVTSGIEPTYG
jgi:D-amino peptidase